MKCLRFFTFRFRFFFLHQKEFRRSVSKCFGRSCVRCLCHESDMLFMVGFYFSKECVAINKFVCGNNDANNLCDVCCGRLKTRIAQTGSSMLLCDWFRCAVLLISKLLFSILLAADIKAARLRMRDTFLKTIDNCFTI